MANEEIRTILAPLTNGYVMLPNSVVSEILEFTSPEPFKQGPAWLLGEVAWHHWQVPVINYEGMLKGSSTKITSKSPYPDRQNPGGIDPGQLHRPGHSGLAQAQKSTC